MQHETDGVMSSIFSKVIFVFFSSGDCECEFVCFFLSVLKQTPTVSKTVF